MATHNCNDCGNSDCADCAVNTAPTERRRNVLTPADKNELRQELHNLFEEHRCQFADCEVQLVKDFVSIYKETRSTVIKLVIGAFFVFLLTMFTFGVKNGYFTQYTNGR